VESLTGRLLWDLVKHLKQWLLNLTRAGDKRKQEALQALRQVILVARETQVYMRHHQKHQTSDAKTEAYLSTQWTELAFLLKDLGLGKLAKRCDIKGRYWADPKQFDQDFIEKADIGLERIEHLARLLVREIESRG